MKISNLLKYLAVAALSVLVMGSCKKDDPEPKQEEIKILNLGMANPISITPGQTISIAGSGFAEGDKIVFRADTDYQGTTVQVDASRFIRFTLPLDAKSGTYDVYVYRGDANLKLGSTQLLVTVSEEVPDKDGATIKGIVHHMENRLKGVVVSDGFEVTTTDENGYYWLNSQKKHGYVFISIPSGYMPAGDVSFPRFWSKLSTVYLSPVVEQHNFELTPVANDNHIVLFSTDHHLANRNLDITQFRNGFKADVKQFVSANAGTPVYSIMMGDQSWDTYWYNRPSESNIGSWTVSYDITSFRSEVKDLGLPMFFAMGNHDYDMKYSITNIPDATEADFQAEAAYKSALGPSYFSFNIGKVHYVCIDNLIWNNAWSGSVYNREYARTVSQWQLDWLKKDLQQVTDKSTPIVAYFHVPVHKPSISLNNTRFVTDVTGTNNITNATAFSQLFSEFSDVHFVSGHTHRNNPISNSKMPAGRQNIYEHNAASVGGTWWWSGRLSSVNVGTDGTPGGYKVFDISNKSINWYYKSFAKNKDYQFRAFDMNKVKAELGKSTYDGFYSSTVANKDRYTWAAANSVLVNVFSWDQDWTIEVEENGSKLAAGKVRQVRANDPLHVLAYALPRYTMSGASAGFMTEPTHHMFYIEPANGTSTLKITVTDNFGNKYIENMTRPKDFNVNMY